MRPIHSRERSLTENCPVCWKVGCGNSQLAAQLHEDGFPKVWSVDVSPTVIKQMKAAHTEKKYPGLTYEVMDAFNMKFHNGFFDTIIDKATLEAVPTAKHDTYFRELSRVLRLGGKYILITDMASVPVPDSFTCVARQHVTRTDHAKGDVATLYVFVNDPQKACNDVLADADEWRAPFDDDDEDDAAGVGDTSTTSSAASPPPVRQLGPVPQMASTYPPSAPVGRQPVPQPPPVGPQPAPQPAPTAGPQAQPAPAAGPQPSGQQMLSNQV